MNNLPSIQINQDISTYRKLKISRLIYSPSSQASISNIYSPNNINAIKNTKIEKIPSNNSYDYFNTTISHNALEKYINSITDEKFIFFLKYGIIRRFEGECDVIYIEIPQIPKKLIVYRLPHSRAKSLEIFNLNSKDLPLIPLFENEDKLKYLSMESNHINKIEHLVSLNNLVYLNLYGNNIREIENLNNVKKLKILILSRNNINQIKNLNILTDLEVLDLHSNKIKFIEGLQSLKKLKEINLSNNLLCSFHELTYNKNLEDINLRKNLIATVPNLSCGMFETLKILNLSKNLINKINYLEELSKINSLKEIYLEYNPVLNNPESAMYVNKLPIKGKFPVTLNSSNTNDKSKSNTIIRKKEIGIVDNNKSNNNISENFKLIQRFKKPNETFFRINKLKKSANHAFSTTNLKNPAKKIDEEKSNRIMSSLMSTISVRNLSPDLSRTKVSFNVNGKLNLKLKPRMNNAHKTIYKTLNVKNKTKFTSNNDLQLSLNLGTKAKDLNNDKIININIKILAITKQWSKEYENIIINGYNGYSNKKSRETFMNQGYIEVDGENNNCLTLFGNCLKILTKTELYNNINVLKFNYFNFDLITCKKYFGFIKAFKDIKKFYFNFNNIFSFYQLTKLENFENLESIHISNNEICCSDKLVKLFIIYRMRKIKVINNELIKLDDKILSNKIFSEFDNLILIKENQMKDEQNNNYIDKEEDKNKIKNENNVKDDKDADENCGDKFIMWNFVKQNLSTALYSIISENEE